MKYFVPAWYNNDQWWRNLNQPFYIKNAMIEFDDSISLMSMHEKNDEDFKLLHLSFNPNLRLFLHKYDLYEANIWSLFDEIQGFEDIPPRSFQFEDLEWPDNTEFFYSPYLIQAMKAHYVSKIYFNQDGYLIVVDDFEHDIHQRRYIFDERGYLSAIRYYDELGHEQYQDYLTASGDVVLRENLETNVVQVMADHAHQFHSKTYPSMVDLITERLNTFCNQHMQANDKLIVSSHIAHNGIFNTLRDDVQVYYSIFNKRNRTIDQPLIKSMAHSNKWLVDTHENEHILHQLIETLDTKPEILRFTPFDTQILENLSSQLDETYIGVWIDGLNDDYLQILINDLITYIKRHPSYRLVILTKNSATQLQQWLSQLIQNVNETFNEEDEDDLAKSELIQAKSAEDFEELVQIQSVPFEYDVLKALSRLRIVIDLNDEPDLFLQIASISVRIPQINMHQSSYVTHLENGYLINSYADITTALDYFLSTLKHWNGAFTFNTNMIEDLSSGHIIEQLDHFLEGDNHAT